jgi:hypothetical protein
VVFILMGNSRRVKRVNRKEVIERP